jgi:pyridinium-3,5-biscarboxylic acid mononucleotide sulfurtransferase
MLRFPAPGAECTIRIDQIMTETDPEVLLARLEEAIRPLGSLVIAFSGGVDSGVLLAAALRSGNRVVALTADSPSMARRELRDARRFAHQLEADHVVLPTAELEIADYARNDGKRCYWCKATLFAVCESYARREGFETIAYGFTADDEGDFRPGHLAAQQFGVASPLHAARLGKREIRAIARHLQLELWDKPAAPCLASRVPYGSEVTNQKLEAIERVEDLLDELGFRIFRARFDGTLMRIEVLPEEIERAAGPSVWEALAERASEAGVPALELDREGFVSGKLNRTLGAAVASRNTGPIWQR